MSKISQKKKSNPIAKDLEHQNINNVQSVKIKKFIIERKKLFKIIIRRIKSQAIFPNHDNHLHVHY